MPLTGEVRRSPERSARPSAAADSEERQILYDVLIRGERWIVFMLSPIVHDVQRQRCWKRGSGDRQQGSKNLFSNTCQGGSKRKVLVANVAV